MKYYIETLTPLHTGTGSRINPIEYVIDDRFYRVDMNELFRDASFNNERFISNTKGAQLYLGDAGPELGKKHARYNIRFSDEHTKQNLNKSLGSSNAEVYEFIKNTDLPYIPGSSIKGAIRTVILWCALKDDEKLYQKVKNTLIKQRKVKPKEADDQIDRLVFGKSPNYDLLRALQVSDTNNLKIDNLCLYNVRTLSTKIKGYGWKQFIVFIEALKIGANLEGTLKVDDFLLDDKVAEKLGFSGKQDLIRKISENCNYFASDFIENEIKFYNNCGLSQLAAEYERLAGLIPPSKKGFLLHLGWGSGWHGMTAGRLLQEDSDFDFNNLRRNLRLGKLGVDIFPKTRKIVFEKNLPKYPLGWVKIKLEQT